MWCLCNVGCRRSPVVVVTSPGGGGARPTETSIPSLPRPTTQTTPAPRSGTSFLPAPFHPNTGSPAPRLDQHTKRAGGYAGEVSQLIHDLYSEVAVPFNPLVERTTIPDWILLQSAPGDRGMHAVGFQPTGWWLYIVSVLFEL